MELAGNAEGQLPAFDSTVIHDGRITEGSPGYCDRDAADSIVNDFVTAQRRNRIGAAISPNFNTDHKILPSEPGCLVSFLK